VTWAFFLTIFSLLRPSILDLGQARDRQTDDRQRTSLHYAPTMWEQGIVTRK